MSIDFSRPWEERHRERFIRAERELRSAGSKLTGEVPAAKPYVQAVKELFDILLLERSIDQDKKELLTHPDELYGR